MNEFQSSSASSETSINHRGVDLDGRTAELRRDIASLLRRSGSKALESFCQQHDIVINGDATESLIAHFRSLDQKAKTLSKFRSKFTKWINKSL